MKRKQPVVRNAANARQLTRATDLARAQAIDAADAVRVELATPAARARTWQQLEALYAKRPPMGDPMVLGFWFGARHHAEGLRDRILDAARVDPGVIDLFLLMQREAFLDAVSADSVTDSTNQPADVPVED
jgi:hypothetical protein